MTPQGGGVSPSQKTVKLGDNYGDLPTPTRTGYNFGGWKNGSLIVTASTQNTTVGNHTLTSQWTPQTFTITFNKQSGSGGSSTATATYGQALPTITIPTRNGYKFEGYFSSTGGSGTKYYNADGTSATTWSQTSSITLYAYWSIPPTTLTISGNGVNTYSWGGSAYWDINLNSSSKVFYWGNNYGTITLTAGGGGGRWVYSIISLDLYNEDLNTGKVYKRKDSDNSDFKPTISSAEQTGAITISIPASYIHSIYDNDDEEESTWTYVFQAKSVINGSSITASFDLYPQ